MDVVTTLGQWLEIIQKLGFPLWAAVVLWAAIQITKAVNTGLTELRNRDAHLQTVLEKHIATSDTRIALIEQLVQRHDDNIRDLWQIARRDGDTRS